MTPVVGMMSKQKREAVRRMRAAETLADFAKYLSLIAAKKEIKDAKPRK